MYYTLVHYIRHNTSLSWGNFHKKCIHQNKWNLIKNITFSNFYHPRFAVHFFNLRFVTKFKLMFVGRMIPSLIKDTSELWNSSAGWDFREKLNKRFCSPDKLFLMMHYGVKPSKNIYIPKTQKYVYKYRFLKIW